MVDGLLQKRICVTGGGGFLGRAVCSRLHALGAESVFVPRRREFDLTQPEAVERLFKVAEPQIVIHLAAEVGGIGANQRSPGRFFYANMAMGLNLIEAARIHDVERFVQVGTVCAYPSHCPAPFSEGDLWNGYPEETNAPYGVAKRALAVMLDAYRRQYGFNGVYLIPTNLYGPGDNFDLETSHVVPAMIRKFAEASERGLPAVSCWGTGQATRELLYVDDAAEAIVRASTVLNTSEPINLGTGDATSISDLARLIARLTGFRGKIEWDTSRPDGQRHRVVDTQRARKLLNWSASTTLEEGLARTIEWWPAHRPALAHNRLAEAASA